MRQEDKQRREIKGEHGKQSGRGETKEETDGTGTDKGIKQGHGHG